MNPLLLRALPYIAAFMLGAALSGGAAWKIQGLRITAAEQDLTEYRQGVAADVLAAETKHQLINQEVSDGWAQNLTALRDRFAVRRVLPAAAGAASTVPEAAAVADAAAGEPDPGAAGLAPALNKAACAADALHVLFLQHWINQVDEQ